jgi:hypothetical protein
MTTPGPLRLTKTVVQRLLEQNEGFATTTQYTARNSREHRRYWIEGGKLLIRLTGKTSWADSRYDRVVVADPDQTRRFLRGVLDALNTDGVK